jgi:hypothetical protein
VSIKLIDPFGNCMLEAIVFLIKEKFPDPNLNHKTLRAMLSFSLISEYFRDVFACMLAQGNEGNEGTKSCTSYCRCLLAEDGGFAEYFQVKIVGRLQFRLTRKVRRRMRNLTLFPSLTHTVLTLLAMGC